METKATRLEKLKNVVPVPNFVRFPKGNPVRLDAVPDWQTYIVRGVSKEEDQENISHAGQFVTIGPIRRNGVLGAIERILGHDWSQEVIVQEYREGLSGVAFCFSEDSFFIEYSAGQEGVTSGKIRPFVALLPTETIGYYRKLQKHLETIFSVFGPSDVEFISIDDPAFVQVRPITSNFTVDTEMIRLQMLLQKTITGKWVENDLAQVIGEHQRFDTLFVLYYLQTITSVMKRYFNRDIQASLDDVINIGKQYFVSERFVDMTKLGYSDIFRFVFVFIHEQHRLRDIYHVGTLNDLFEKSILSSMAYTILKKREFLNIREQYRQRIDALLSKENSPNINIRRFSYDQSLDSVIELDHATSTWKVLQKRDSRGIQVVPGEFDPKHFFDIRKVTQYQMVPSSFAITSTQILGKALIQSKVFCVPMAP